VDPSDLRMADKVCLITGGTGGIGEVTTRALARLGATVVVVARSEERCQATIRLIQDENRQADGAAVATAVARAEYLVADLAEMSQVRRAAQEFLQRHNRLDVLVNNVGATFTSRRLTSEGIEATWALNHLSYFLLTDLLLGALKNTATQHGEARIVNVSSAAHRGARIYFDDLQGERSYNSWRAYGQSKLANVLFTFELERRLRGTQVSANALHPGFVATRFGENNGAWMRAIMRILHRFAISPEEGAETSIYLASSPRLHGVSGLYFVRCQPTGADPAGYDQLTARRLWEVSEQMIANQHVQ
jgi:retinol dehydrogenase 12